MKMEPEKSGIEDLENQNKPKFDLIRVGLIILIVLSIIILIFSFIKP